MVGLLPHGNVGVAWPVLQGRPGTMRVARAAFPGSAAPCVVGAVVKKHQREFFLKSFEINIPVNHQMLKNKQVVPG